MNKLFFGDCLDVLKDLHCRNPEGFIDMIYIDPPFNSKRNYHILFESYDMSGTKAQKQAFADTWSNISYIDSLNEILEHLKDKNLYTFLKTIEQIGNSKSVISYLTTMAIRIYFMKFVLKDTGTFFLHCDPTMSHYLKIICDFIFGKDNFRNEIVWKRMTASGFKGKKDIGASHDIIFRYSKSQNFNYYPVIKDYTQEYIKEKFNKTDEYGRKFKDEKIGTATSEDTIERLKSDGRIYYTKNGTLRIKHYLDEAVGFPIDDVWSDLPPINSQAKERLGYDTQKPEALLERIIKSSSKEGDLIADFFCGCGTTVAVSQRLNRRWLGVDISHLAIRLIMKRLTDPFEEETKVKIRSLIEINGFPKDIDSAKELALSKDKGRMKFEDWIIEVMLGGISNPKKNTEGYDGYITFPKTDKERGIILIEVKSGNVSLPQFQHFINTVKSQNADMGTFICFNSEVTNNMLKKAKEEGNFFAYNINKIQIITVEELLEGKNIRYPGYVENSTFKKNTVRNGDSVQYQDKIF
ncbi:MAG: hypothetical protein QG635_2468 [Bacteroidota bacterium]|nr:hypothetical protein [Bacteroidota bacterium]